MRAKHLIVCCLLTVSGLAPLCSFAQSPLIIVNGNTTELTDLKAIPPADIERIETETVDEQSIEKYGERANNGIIHVTLKYDTPARFTLAPSFDDHIESLVRWNDDEPAARVTLRYTISTDGRIAIGEILEATEGRLKRRVLAALAQFTKNAAWEPARRNGEAVVTERVLQIRLPKGKAMPREPYIIII